MSDDYKNKFLKKYFSLMEKRVKENENSDFIVGNSFTIADAYCAAIAYTYIFNEHNPCSKEYYEVIENYPKVEGYFKRLGNIFEKYLHARKPMPY